MISVPQLEIAREDGDGAGDEKKPRFVIVENFPLVQAGNSPPAPKYSIHAEDIYRQRYLDHERETPLKSKCK